MHVEAAFAEAMAKAALVTQDPIIADGTIHRIHIEGHRKASRNGAYKLFADRHPAGWWMDFKSGVSGTWKLGGGKWKLDPETLRQIAEERRKREIEREVAFHKKANEAACVWAQADPCTSHPYLTRKGVQAHGLRVGRWEKWVQTEAGWTSLQFENVLFVPLMAPNRILVNVQAILPEPHPLLESDKYYNGGRKQGCCIWLGKPTPKVMIAEGYATAASIHENTGNMVVVAFDAGNLLSVAQRVRAGMPDATIVLCADDDRFTKGNPGVTKATEAAKAVKGLLSVPAFPEGSTGTDWNDWYTKVQHGG